MKFFPGIGTRKKLTEKLGEALSEKLKNFFAAALKWYFIATVVGVFIFWGYRVYTSWMTLPLSLWHTASLDDMTEDEIDSADWDEYMRREDALFARLKKNVSDKLPVSARNAGNRYYEKSPMYPDNFSDNWNRSYILTPDNAPVGSVVLLHGLTDSPYSLWHVAELYRKSGYVAAGIRLPGHGTIPAELTRVKWESWMAAANLAIREALRLAPEGSPFHIVGYSNGAALAMNYALDAIEDEKITMPHRMVFISPMIGITRYARYVGLAAIPSLFPRFAKTAWLNILPEYNPFKYNSFPVNGPRQSYRLTRDLQFRIQELHDEDMLLKLPPIISFQSLMDDTVSTAAIFHYLYGLLPENGSEITIFDVNRATDLTPLIKPASDVKLLEILPKLPVQYTLGIITNDKVNDEPVAESCLMRVSPGRSSAEKIPLGMDYPPDIFSLSHIAIPFPMDDPLYGIDAPDDDPEFGVSLGRISARGEIGMLAVKMESIYRTTSNPFFPYMMARISELIADPMPRSDVKPGTRYEVSPDLLEREKERLTREELEDQPNVVP